jgi:serine/threonine protein phosphatase PrpC
MLSDGVCQGIEESTWLIELLSKPPKRNLKEYAEEILSSAIRRCTVKDDMTVSVIRLYKR